MTFASAIFLFAFLPIFLACYFLTPSVSYTHLTLPTIYSV